MSPRLRVIVARPVAPRSTVRVSPPGGAGELRGGGHRPVKVGDVDHALQHRADPPAVPREIVGVGVRVGKPQLGGGDPRERGAPAVLRAALVVLGQIGKLQPLLLPVGTLPGRDDPVIELPRLLPLPGGGEARPCSRAAPRTGRCPPRGSHGSSRCGTGSSTAQSRVGRRPRDGVCGGILRGRGEVDAHPRLLYSSPAASRILKVTSGRSARSHTSRFRRPRSGSPQRRRRPRGCAAAAARAQGGTRAPAWRHSATCAGRRGSQ